MLKTTATINDAAESSKKCSQCGLRNFANRKKCKRCKTDLSSPLNVTKEDSAIQGSSGELGRSTFTLAWILAVLVVVLLGLFVLYIRQGPQATAAEASSDAGVTQNAVAPDAEQPAENAAEKNAQSEAAANQILVELKRFQDATERGMKYDEYEKGLESLKNDLNTELPSFISHNPSDENFRQEVAGALREYTAAGNWWKTSIDNSTVFTDADRNERTQKNWASARAHLTNAEKMLVR